MYQNPSVDAFLSNPPIQKANVLSEGLAYSLTGYRESRHERPSWQPQPEQDSEDNRTGTSTY
jgi:hypothetical protein